MVETREVTKERHASYAYAAQVFKNSQIPYRLFTGGMIILSVWVNSQQVQVRVAEEANADTVIKETIESTFRRKKRQDRDIPYFSNYVLKICAQQLYFYFYI
jgi:hypothetical protein